MSFILNKVMNTYGCIDYYTNHTVDITLVQSKTNKKAAFKVFL